MVICYSSDGKTTSFAHSQKKNSYFSQMFILTSLLNWASFIAQLVKNLPAMQETLVQFFGWEDLLEKGQATHSIILGLSLWLSW